MKTSDWGKKTIEQLATFIQTQEPGIKGFERRNLYRMRNFQQSTIVAEYEIKLIPKETLRRKLNEFYELLSDRVR